MSEAFISEPGRQTPVRDHVDVIVAGGGLGGIAAAIAAARSGANVLLIERNSFVGGVATAGMCCSIFNCFFTSEGKLGPSGVPVEITDALANAMGYGDKWRDHLGHIIYDIELGKYVLQKLLLDANVSLLLDTSIVDTVIDNGRVTGVIIESKSGREAVCAKAVIDATGDADVVARAGGQFVSSLSHAPIHSLCFKMGNVDTDTFVDYFRSSPDQYPAFMDVDWTVEDAIAQYDDCGTFLFPHGGGIQMSAFKEAIKQGDLPPTVGIHDTTDACQMHVMKQMMTAHVVTGFVRFDGLDIDKITQSINDGREMVFTVSNVYRKYIPGFQNAYVAGTAANLGVRFSRRIVPDCLFTVDQSNADGRAERPVGRCVSYSHQKKHKGEGAWGAQVMSNRTYQIPLGCLLPAGLDGVIMGAGRSAGTDQYWLLRVMVTTMAVGQGAGVTAALAAAKDCPMRDLDSDALKTALADLGADLD